MAILGLVVRKPDTVAGIRKRLTERFPHSGWSSSVAYSDLTSLAGQGFVRMTAQGEKRGEDSYEATSGGEEHFRVWLRESSEAAPALHDPTRARLELCEPEDLPMMLRLLEVEEQICSDRFDAARLRLNKARRSGHFGPADGSDARGRMVYALMADDIMIWGNRALRLKRLRGELEGHGPDVEPDDDERDA
jgi:DNA-binding PadR family transcriptional regulator